MNPTTTLLHELLAATLLLAGSGFMLLAAVGVLRLPDVYLRLSATTKSATLGVSSLLAGVAVGFADWEAVFTALLVMAFFLLTAPVAAHVIGRAAYFAGAPLWEGTHHDALRHGAEDAPVGRGGEGAAGPRDGPPRDAPAPPDPDASSTTTNDDPPSREEAETAGAAVAAGTTKSV